MEPDGVDMVLCCVRLKFEKSSLRWRIVGREYKILKLEFFNPLVLLQSLHEVLGCSRYVDMPTGGANCVVCRHAFSALLTGPPWLLTGVSRKLGVEQTGSVCRQANWPVDSK